MSEVQRIAVLIGVLLLLVFVWFRWNPNEFDHPELGHVTGKVTLDGKPLAGAIIAFFPEVGRMATALIDKEGRYDLQYSNGIRGTKLGPSTVHFAWQTGESGPAIPERYGDRSDLTVDVQEKKNIFDFELVSTPPEESASPSDKSKSKASNTRPRRKTPVVVD